MNKSKPPKCKRCTELEFRCAILEKECADLKHRLKTSSMLAAMKEIIKECDTLAEQRDALEKQVEEFKQERDEREWNQQLQAARHRRDAERTVVTPLGSQQHLQGNIVERESCRAEASQ